MPIVKSPVGSPSLKSPLSRNQKAVMRKIDDQRVGEDHAVLCLLEKTSRWHQMECIVSPSSSGHLLGI